jgi:GNAT superfamily N-acetyltransferase
MNIMVRPVEPASYGDVHAFQCEYLDAEEFNAFTDRVASNPDLYLAAYHHAELVAVCYGQPSLRNHAAVQLQGIAVNLDETNQYARKGIGSAILRQFEKAAKNRGFRSIDVGSADDLKVEHFYLKNGFMPYELVANGPDHEELERVCIPNYELGKETQETLRKKHGAREVIFIFRKSID